jgi:alkaline phosphatase D
VHPETAVEEFSCGPASDPHAGGSPGEDPKYHRFHHSRGGFLSVSFRRDSPRNKLVFRFHDVHGKPSYTQERTRN